MNNFKKSLLIAVVTLLFAFAALGSSSSESSSSSSSSSTTTVAAKKIEITAEPIANKDDIENTAEENDNSNEENVNKYVLNVHINFATNLLLSTYDVDLYVDSQKIETLSHGHNADYEFTIFGGEHKIKFISTEDSLVKGEIILSVDSNIDASYKINCYSSEVTVTKEFEDHKIELTENQIKMDRSADDYEEKNYEAVLEALTELGFTNIETQADYDIVFGVTKEGSVESVSINGITDFKRADIFEKDYPVIITYHMGVEDNPEVNESTSNSATTVKEEKSEEYDVDKDLVVAMCEKDKKYKTRYNITFAEYDSSGNPIYFYTFDNCVNPRDMGEEFDFIGGLPSWFYVGATVHVKANMSGNALSTYKCAVTQIKTEQIQTTSSEEKVMPVMSGTSLDKVVETAKSFGLSQLFSDEDWGHGTKMKTLSNPNGGLTMDIVYSTSTKEILCASIITLNLVSSQEQLDFIVGMSKVTCPAADMEKVSNWINGNIGQAAKESISEFVYELSFGPTNNALYFAGEENWEKWELSFD